MSWSNLALKFRRLDTTQSAWYSRLLFTIVPSKDHVLPSLGKSTSPCGGGVKRRRSSTMRRLSKPVSSLLCGLGLGLIMLGWGGFWGIAYGQTAGPTPTARSVVKAITATKSVSPSSGMPNDPLTFSVQVRNNDTVPQTNVVFTDRILDFLEVITVATTKGSVASSGQDVRVEIGTLEPGETVTVTITVRIRATAQSGDSGVNIASISSGTDTTTTTTTSNPVAISVGQAPPNGLPNTSNPGQRSPWLMVVGLVVLLLGAGTLLKQRQWRTK